MELLGRIGRYIKKKTNGDKERESKSVKGGILGGPENGGYGREKMVNSRTEPREGAFDWETRDKKGSRGGEKIIKGKERSQKSESITVRTKATVLLVKIGGAWVVSAGENA